MECWEERDGDCSVGSETSVFQQRRGEGVDVVGFCSVGHCDHLHLLLGFVCRLGSAQSPFQEQMAQRQDRHEEKIRVLHGDRMSTNRMHVGQMHCFENDSTSINQFASLISKKY